MEESGARVWSVLREANSDSAALSLSLDPRQDHHCNLIDRCVGSKNRVFFVGYTCSLAAVCIVFCILAAHALEHTQAGSMMLRLAWWDFAAGSVVNLVLVAKQLGLLRKTRTSAPMSLPESIPGYSGAVTAV